MTIASIDIGTNTVLLLIAETEISSSKFKSVLNLQRIPRIGKGLIPGSAISEEKINDLYNILNEYVQIINRYKCDTVLINATNAFRIASNGMLIVNGIKDRFNIEIKIITGEEEANLSYLGATSSFKTNSNNLVIDIGGGSTELIYGKKDKVDFVHSYQVGAVSGTEKYYKNNPPLFSEQKDFIDSVKELLKEITSKNFSPENVIAIAGTPTTLACINKKLTEYDESLIEGSILKYDEMEDIIKELSTLTSEEIKQKYKSIVNGREDVLLAGSQILYTIMDLLSLNEVTVSARGIRYGAIVDYLSKNIKD
jgi:exopolyphosphatase / guanosine-5'-triphosphate,3'-diphosphate pyrophosphatase